MAVTRAGRPGWPRFAAVASLAALWTAPLAGQAVVRGTVAARDGDTPIDGVTIVLRRSGTATTTDRLGRFAIAVAAWPDTLVLAAIGWAADTVVVERPPQAPLHVRLARAPVIVSDLIVAAPAVRPLDLAEHGQWRMPMAAARTVPPAVEADIYRALALVPGVSFTSPLSARPMIRGYDAQEVTTRIDGFEVFNLYHLGRVFSSYPPDATEQLTVSAAPYTASRAGSISGLVDVAGRTGRPDGLHGGGGVSFGSFSAWAGGGDDRVRVFAAGRLLHLETLELIPGVDLPYHFEDFYGSAVFGPVERPDARVTAFATRDAVGEDGDGLRWHNLLLGGRWRVHERGAVGVELNGSVSRYAQRGERVPSLHRSTADFRNDFDRVALGADLTATGRAWRFAAGATAGWRRIVNLVERTELNTVSDFPVADIRARRAELGGYAELSRRLGAVTLQAGLRADAAGDLLRAEPRAHARWSVARRVELSAGVGRTSRLFHLIADARSEPDFEFLDFWIDPGDSIPVARVDHAVVDIQVDLAPVVARASAFASSGRGVGELRPEADQAFTGSPYFRFGRARTRGIELQIALRGGDASPHSLSATWVLSRSDRDWGAGWTRWAQDRRHQLRLFGQTGVGRLTLFGALDAATGMPLTPRTGTVDRLPPGGEAAQLPGYGGHAVLYGAENSVATSGTFRIDAGANVAFGGPTGRRFTLGVSVINLLFGAVAPISDRGEGRVALDPAGRATPYRRLFDLPPIPTLTLRVEL